MASSPSSAPTKARLRPKRLGSETPRVWTQPLRPLTPKTSLGFAVIEFAAEILHFELLPWQRWLLIHALELRPNGKLRYRNVVVLVSRQNGKSTLSQVLSLWWLFVCGVRLVLGTAQELDTAEEVWQGAIDLVLEQDEDENFIRPEMAEMVSKVNQTNGKKSLQLKSGERYKIKAANRRAGRGMSGDRIILDELREHQSWHAWGAITKTTMARPNAQIWCFSNAGDITSVVLRHLRRLAHAPLGDPDGLNTSAEVEAFTKAPTDEHLDELQGLDFEPEDDDLGIFEWSAAPGCDVWDRDAWAQANPSLGYTITEATIASAARTDPEWVFRTEVLCQWADGVIAGAFPAGAWERCGVKAVDGRLPAAEQIVPGSKLYAALEVSQDRKSACVVVAGYRPDGHPQVEVRASSLGTDWIVPWFTDPKRAARRRYTIVIRTGSGAWSLVDDLRAAGLTVLEWKGTAVPDGCGNLFDAVRDNELRHTSQPILNLPATTAITRLLERGTWVWSSKSPHDIAALWGATAALWALSKPKAEPPPPPAAAVVVNDRRDAPDELGESVAFRRW